jgi:poly-gamma-glutamate synthesis protein (capsule biosynthesis protein)
LLISPANALQETLISIVKALRDLRITCFCLHNRQPIVLATILSCLFLFIGSKGLQAQPPSCSETQGAVERSGYYSSIAATDMVYSVYLPPCYDQTDRLYPVLYLMHGSNSDDRHWFELGLAETLDEQIATGELPPMIVALPFGNWLANENRFDAVSWENVFLLEFLPEVEANYRVDAGQATRAIGGISRGGFWAFSIAFRHPDLFSAVGGHSAFFARRNAPPEHNPLDLAQNAPGIETLRVWLDRGVDDYAGPNLDLMHERLNARRIQHTYLVQPGEHNNLYWSQHALDYLRFYAESWQAVSIIAVPTTVASSDGQTAEAYDLFLPVVSFPSLRTTIGAERLRAVAQGQPDANLVIDETTLAALQAHGVRLSEETMIVAPDSLFNSLWRDRSAYTLLPFDKLMLRYRVLHLDNVHPLDTDLASYPFAFSSGQPNFYPDRLTRILFSGVTALTRGTIDALDTHGTAWAGEAILPYISRADFFHTSSEVSFTPDCPQSSEPLLGTFCAKDAHFELLTSLGLDIVELSGNHNNDYGFDAYLHTLELFRNSGIQTVGGGATIAEAQEPLILNHNGNRIALISCNWIGPYYALATEDNPGAAACDWNWLRATLPQLAIDNDLLIITVQYQEFEEYTPTPQQQSDFRGLADLGADVVIGTQAHKPQTFEFYNTGRDAQVFIHYGLGNLFFDQPFWGNVRLFMDQLFVYEGRLLTVDLFTGIIEDAGRPRPMDAYEQENFLAFMFVTHGGF